MNTHRILATIVALIVAVGVLASRAPAPAAALPTGTRWVGAYIPGAPASLAPITDLESKIAGPLSVSNYFQNTSQGFTAAQATVAADHGSIPLVTLEFWDPAKGIGQPALSLASIAAGSQDAYLHAYARNAKAFGRAVWLRPFHEMNGNWYPWAGTVNGNAPADFIPAWRHVHDVFAAEGATNVEFVWCPNADSVPNTSANAITKYWPGDGYVDRIALDGYNFGSSATSTWRSFGSVFGSAYAAVTALSAKPVFIAETASSPVGGDKAAWIADMFASIPTTYPRITGVTWFNALKERDWRLECTTACQSSFASGLATWSAVSAPMIPAASITIVTSRTTAYSGVTAVLSGAVQPDATIGEVMSVLVRKPGTSRWSYSSNRTIYSLGGTAAWQYKYVFSYGMTKGTYAFQALLAATATHLAATSPSVASVTLR